MSSPPIAVAGCIHDTYPMMATCTPIQTRTTVPAVNALVRAMRERTKQQRRRRPDHFRTSATDRWSS